MPSKNSLDGQNKGRKIGIVEGLGDEPDKVGKNSLTSRPSRRTKRKSEESLTMTDVKVPAKKKKAVRIQLPPKSLPSSPASSDESGSDSDESVKTHDEVGKGDMHLHGFSTDDDESSDDEEFTGIDISKLPTVAKDDSVVKQKLERAKLQPADDRGVLYLGRIPHGFYEAQLKAYFSQFGTVTRLRLSRNKKTGKSKHYGFIEFDSSSVAKIVAETMDNYLLLGHILRCKVVKKNDVHPELWVGANRKWRTVPQDRLTRLHHNKLRTEEERSQVAKRLLKRQNERKRKLSEAGIQYDFDSVSYKRQNVKIVDPVT